VGRHKPSGIPDGPSPPGRLSAQSRTPTAGRVDASPGSAGPPPVARTFARSRPALERFRQSPRGCRCEAPKLAHSNASAAVERGPRRDHGGLRVFGGLTGQYPKACARRHRCPVAYPPTVGPANPPRLETARARRRVRRRSQRQPTPRPRVEVSGGPRRARSSGRIGATGAACEPPRVPAPSPSLHRGDTPPG
jgi:hypothetical protein